MFSGQAKMSGREAFAFDPTLFGGDDDDDDFDFDDLSDNEKDGDDDDGTEAKVWESNTYSTSDYRHADDEVKNLFFLLYIDLVKKKRN